LGKSGELMETPGVKKPDTVFSGAGGGLKRKNMVVYQKIEPQG